MGKRAGPSPPSHATRASCTTYCRLIVGDLWASGGTYCKRYCLALAAGSRAGSVNCLYRRPPILLPTTRRPNTYLPPNLARHPPTTLTLRPTAEYMVSPNQPFPGSLPLTKKFQTPWWMSGGEKLENSCGFGVRCGKVELRRLRPYRGNRVRVGTGGSGVLSRLWQLVLVT